MIGKNVTTSEPLNIFTKNAHLPRRLYQPLVQQICDLPRKRTPVQSSSNPTVINSKVDISVGSVHLHVRAAKGVWLRWDIGKIFVSQDASQEGMRFGVRMASQLVGAYTSMRKTKARDASTIRLPSLTAMGTHRALNSRYQLSATVNLGFFVGILKPAVLDRLLSLHQRLATDIRDFVKEYGGQNGDAPKAGHSDPVSPSPNGSSSPDKTPSRNPLFDLHLSVAGVRVGLKADDVAATLLFEAFALNGHATNQNTKDAAIHWRGKVEHFGLSLGHVGTADLPEDAEPSRRYRSAYMGVDVDVQEIPCTASRASQLNICLSRVHTVMHVAALSELCDLVRSWQSDIHILRDNRADEVAEIKDQTARMLKKLDTTPKTDRPDRPDISWFANRLFTVEVAGLGIAIPLDEGAAINLQQDGSAFTPALLFSIRVISFHNKRNETARFRMQQMALQFLDKWVSWPRLC